MALDEVQSGQMKFEEEGDDVAGILISNETRPGQNGPSETYEVRTEDGIVFFYGSQILDDKLSKVIDEKGLGAVVKIEFTGYETSQSTGNDYKTFKVLSGEANEENLASVGLEPDLLEEDDEDDEDEDEDLDF